MEIKGLFNAFRNITDSQKYPIISQVKEMASEANRRIDELKKSGITSQALNNWEKKGSIAFGISKGSYQDYQSEYWRIKNFLDAKTSTVNGAKEVISRMIAVTGMPMGVEELTKQQAQNYFRLADRLSDYYKMIGDTAKALDYQKIWEQINIMIENDITNLNNIDESVNGITRMLYAIDYLNDEIKASEQLGDNVTGLEKATQKSGKFGLPSFLSFVANKVWGAIKPLFKR